MYRSRVVYVIDDDPAVRDSLGMLLSTEGIEARVFDSARSFLAGVSPSDRACVVTDVRMPEISGIELISRMKLQGLDMPIVVITAHGDVPLAVEAMKLGAVDFLEKPFDNGVFLNAVQRAFAPTSPQPYRLVESDPSEGFATLTGRENEVLERLLDGLPNKAIARDLGISVRTVEVHRANVMSKTRAKNLAELVRMALAAQRAHS